MGMILGVVLSGHVVEMNDSPKSDALSEKSKEKIVTIDCLWYRLGWWGELRKVQEKILDIALKAPPKLIN